MHKVKVGLCVASLVLLVQGLAFSAITSMDSASFANKYECDVNPQDAGFAVGTLNSNYPATLTTASDGILSCGLYNYIDGTGMFPASPVTDYTVEYRSKTLSGAGAYPGFGMMVSNPISLTWFAVGTTQVMEAYSTATVTGLDNSSDFHTYRIAYEGDTDTYTFWRDSQLLLTGVPGETMGTPGALGLKATYGSIFQFGSLSGSAIGEAQVDYVRWDMTGAYSPVPEPMTLALLSLGGLLLRRRS